ncbi:MAG: hypothetical protein Q9174_001372 [Haloplaca sp. 1 TL-2023]
MSPTPITTGAISHHHSVSNTSDKHASTPWSPASDEQLMHARQQGMNWQPIAETYFPNKTANACRKRHERLMEKKAAIGSWDAQKFEELARIYCELREPAWRLIAERLGEDWKTVEAKCMEKGVKNLSSMGRAASRKDKPMPNGDFKHDLSDDGRLCLDTHSSNEGAGDDQNPFSADSYSSRRTTISNVSTASFPPSLPRATPVLPNFSQGFSSNTSLPGISSIVGPSGLPVTTH